MELEHQIAALADQMIVVGGPMSSALIEGVPTLEVVRVEEVRLDQKRQGPIDGCLGDSLIV